jgi:hypothetical protein
MYVCVCVCMYVCMYGVLGDVDELWGVGNVTLSYQDELRTIGMCVCVYVCMYGKIEM